MAIPAKFRSQIERDAVTSGQSGAVMSRGIGCLLVYTALRFHQKSEELASGKTSEELRDFELRFYPYAEEVEPDAQGRIIIPGGLRKYAQLDADVTVIGMRDHFEIWDRAAWEALQEKLSAEGRLLPF